MKYEFKNPLAQAVFDEAKRITKENLEALAAGYELCSEPTERIRAKEVTINHRLDGFLAAAEAAYRIECAGPAFQDWAERLPDFSGIELVENREILNEAKRDIQELLTALKSAITETTRTGACETFNFLREKYSK